MLYPKFKYARNKAYLRWVAAHDCFACGISGYSQAAHSNQGRHGHGRSVKSSDEFTFPLCSERPGHMGCHKMHDLCYEMTKDERDALEDAYCERMQSIAAMNGWSDGKKSCT